MRFYSMLIIIIIDATEYNNNQFGDGIISMQ